MSAELRKHRSVRGAVRRRTLNDKLTYRHPGIDALADRVKAEFGTVDALFANVGVNGFAPFEATSEELFDELLTINAKGPYFTVQKLAPLLAEGSGVVLTTSVANVLGVPALSAYAASKAALRSMTRSLARELLPRKIRVNAVSPGPIDSGILGGPSRRCGFPRRGRAGRRGVAFVRRRWSRRS
jgi:NAD(P)-dependent dehydrogenase (short-subunit alcohol dehydrogenase family)